MSNFEKKPIASPPNNPMEEGQKSVDPIADAIGLLRTAQLSPIEVGSLQAICDEKQTSAQTKTQRALSIAQQIIDSYQEIGGGIFFRIPPDVSVVDALESLNECYRRTFPTKGRDAVDQRCIEWLRSLGAPSSRDVSPIYLELAVNGTANLDWQSAHLHLKQQGMKLAPPGLVVIALAAAACSHGTPNISSHEELRHAIPLTTIALMKSGEISCFEIDSEHTEPHVVAAGVRSVLS